MKAFTGATPASAPLGVLNWDTQGMAIQGRFLGYGEKVGSGTARVETARFQIGASEKEVVTAVCPTILRSKLDDFDLEGEWVTVIYRGKVKLKGGNFAKNFDVYAHDGVPESAGVHRPGDKPVDDDGSDLPF